MREISWIYKKTMEILEFIHFLNINHSFCGLFYEYKVCYDADVRNAGT